MSQKSYLLVTGADEKRADRLKAFFRDSGAAVGELSAQRRNALDAGREEFHRLSANGTKPVIAGYDEGAVLALAIAQRCPAGGLICLSPRYCSNSFEFRRLSRDAARNLFLIVAPTVLGVSREPSALARRMIDQLSPAAVRVIQLGDEELWSDKALNAILNQLHNIRDTKTLVLRQILRL